MVDSNIQRENTPISEKAKAIKIKYEAIKRQGARTDLTSPKFSAKLRSDDEIGRQMGISRRKQEADAFLNLLHQHNVTLFSIDEGLELPPHQELNITLLASL